MSVDRIWNVLPVVAVAGSIAFGAGVLAATPGSRHPVNAARFNRVTGAEDATETLVVFLVSSFCGASQDAQLKQAMREDRSRMLAEATRRGSHVRFVGEASEGSFDWGIRLVTEFGTFDELVLGSGWMNQALIQYVWRDLPGPASLPQMVVLRRTVHLAENDIGVGHDIVVRRLVGKAEIRDWLRDPTSRF